MTEQQCTSWLKDTLNGRQKTDPLVAWDLYKHAMKMDSRRDQDLLEMLINVFTGVSKEQAAHAWIAAQP